MGIHPGLPTPFLLFKGLGHCEHLIKEPDWPYCALYHVTGDGGVSSLKSQPVWVARDGKALSPQMFLLSTFLKGIMQQGIGKFPLSLDALTCLKSCPAYSVEDGGASLSPIVHVLFLFKPLGSVGECRSSIPSCTMSGIISPVLQSLKKIPPSPVLHLFLKSTGDRVGGSLVHDPELFPDWSWQLDKGQLWTRLQDTASWCSGENQGLISQSPGLSLDPGLSPVQSWGLGRIGLCPRHWASPLAGACCDPAP